ncbi:hypothetical protein CH63R_00017 [Colletotrichum higginsianum IMI 349063]|uniref:Uncharacterized protein n=2 Tax=Colletotrichum higginsianum TaxID=80884 RepID=A0A1B7YS24_COLHI|nr:hypothetical protein CH63R_00017 [Colletotrichum higginsianum IMI 349063]OBR14837.1 hypothetical protein CH63R_00017 [Colletotrichum higginsianum IMI 349063]TID04602.1 hypothetical protein CH35J_003302 [Colletotrichum higginsianum]GJC92882.1 hypothetical protein ColKHC_01708 [Colletotrichum higginsianum]
MSSSKESLGQWVEKWNDLVFYQPDDQLSARTIEDTLDAAATVKINHDVHDFNGLAGGVKWFRTATETTLDSNQEIMAWDAPDGLGGSVAHLSTFTSKDKTSGKVVRKKSLITTIVKGIDGKRKVSELIEVEIEF